MQKNSNISREDLQQLISESVRQNKVVEHEKRRKFCFDLAKVMLTPLVIAFMGWWGTMKITDKEIQNAKEIENRQIESAAIIAKNQIEGANLRSNAERDIAKLGQIRSIYQDIIKEKPDENNKDAIMLQISSLGIYEDLALGFLVNIRDSYKDKNPPLYEFTSITIEKILKKSQPDFKGSLFIGNGDNPLNLRHREFKNFNLSTSRFVQTNLYMAKFNQSTLEGTTFDSVDLYGADFSETNLSGSVFKNHTNLRNANFTTAKLSGVKFINCKYLDDAQFSLKALLTVSSSPFAKMDKDTYRKLLVRHVVKIKEMYHENPDDLKALLIKGDFDNDELIAFIEKHEPLKDVSVESTGENKVALLIGN